MSVEAITWVLNRAPDVPPQLVSTLIGLANHATPDGRNAYPSQPTLAAYTRKSERQVRRDIAELQKLRLIRRGNQRIVEHLPQDRRPVVYDIAMERVKDLDGGSPTSARSSTSARTRVTERPDVDVRDGGSPTSAKPSFEPSRTVPKETPPAPQGPPKPTDRGSRLPNEFPVTPEMAAWAREKAPSCGITDHETFCDFWRAAPGAKGRKLDWEATWRNWMRREHERRSPAARAPATPRVATGDQRYAEIQALKAEMTGTGDNPFSVIRGELA